MEKIIKHIVLGDNKPKIVKPNIPTVPKKKNDIRNNYVISGLCYEFDNFDINVNLQISDGKLYYEKFPVVVDNGKFICELNIIPVCLDYLFVQNIEEYLNDVDNVEPITPDIIAITNMCSLKYIENCDNILCGLNDDVKIPEYDDEQ